MKTIIIDDESASVEVLSTLIRSFRCGLEISATCLNIRDAVKAIALHRPDIIFLDIELADGLGFEILESVPDLQARLVFITAHEHYALKAIKFHAFDYLLKPVIPDELLATISRLMADINNSRTMQAPPLPEPMLSQAPRKIAVPSKSGLSYYSIDEVILVEGDGSYAHMHLSQSRKITVSKKVKDFEEPLVAMGFLRVHKSYLINLNHIVELHRDDSGYLLMSNGSKVPISPKDKEQIIGRIKQSFHTI